MSIGKVVARRGTTDYMIGTWCQLIRQGTFSVSITITLHTNQDCPKSRIGWPPCPMAGRGTAFQHSPKPMEIIHPFQDISPSANRCWPTDRQQVGQSELKGLARTAVMALILVHYTSNEETIGQ